MPPRPVYRTLTDTQSCDVCRSRELRERHLESIASKARAESEKVSEVLFINTLQSREKEIDMVERQRRVLFNFYRRGQSIAGRQRSPRQSTALGTLLRGRDRCR